MQNLLLLSVIMLSNLQGTNTGLIDSATERNNLVETAFCYIRQGDYESLLSKSPISVTDPVLKEINIESVHAIKEEYSQKKNEVPNKNLEAWNDSPVREKGDIDNLGEFKVAFALVAAARGESLMKRYGNYKAARKWFDIAIKCCDVSVSPKLLNELEIMERNIPSSRIYNEAFSKQEHKKHAGPMQDIDSIINGLNFSIVK